MERKFLASLGALVLLAAVADGAAGLAQLAHFALPFLAVAALVLRGRFIGERHIVRRWRRSVRVPARCAHARSRWPAAPEIAPVSWLDRAVRAERGPPALAAV